MACAVAIALFLCGCRREHRMARTHTLPHCGEDVRLAAYYLAPLFPSLTPPALPPGKDESDGETGDVAGGLWRDISRRSAWTWTLPHARPTVPDITLLPPSPGEAGASEGRRGACTRVLDLIQANERQAARRAVAHVAPPVTSCLQRHAMEHLGLQQFSCFCLGEKEGRALRFASTYVYAEPVTAVPFAPLLQPTMPPFLYWRARHHTPLHYASLQATVALRTTLMTCV